MAQADVQGILEGLRIHQQKVIAQRGMDIQQQQADSQREAEQSRAEQQKEQLEQQKEALKQRAKEFEITSKAAKAVHDFNIFQETQKLGQQAMSGIPITGAKATPVASSTGGEPNFSPVNPNQAGAQTAYTLPIQDSSGQPMMIGPFPKPEDVAKQQADLEKIRDRPKVDAKIEESRALQSDLLNKQNEAKDADFKKMLIQKKLDDNRAELDRQSRERMNAATNAAHLAGMKLTKGLPQEWQDYDVTPHVQDALNGDLSREDFARVVLPKEVKQAIEVGVKMGGGVFLDKKQQDVAADYKALGGIVGIMDQLLGVIPKTEAKGLLSGVKTGAVGLLHTFDKDISSLQNQLEGHATVIGRTVSKDNRVSDQDAKRVGMGYFPKANDTYEHNVAKRNQYVKEVNEAIDAKFSMIPKGQREILKQKLGLTDIKPYGLGIPATAAPAQPTQPSPAAIEYLKKYGIN